MWQAFVPHDWYVMTITIMVLQAALGIGGHGHQEV